MPDTKWMILRDTAKKGREIFIGQDTKPQHRYKDSGVQRLAKITANPGRSGWGKFRHAVKVKDQIWVSFALDLNLLDHMWYPLQPWDGDAWRADWERSNAITEEILNRLREEGRRNVK